MHLIVKMSLCLINLLFYVPINSFRPTMTISVERNNKSYEQELFFAIKRTSASKDSKRGSRVVSALSSCARGPEFDPRRRRGKKCVPNTLPFVSFSRMT